MIREYDFPKIFQNVVGEVIPPIPRHRQQLRRPFPLASNLQQLTSSDGISDDPPSPGLGNLYVKSKRKKLVRRLKFTKTSSCFSMKQEPSDEDKLSQNQSGLHMRNFLKRKQLTLQKTEKQSSRLERDEVFEKTGMLDEEDQVCSNLARHSSKRNINTLRLRTSFEHNEYPSHNENHNPNPVKHRISQSNAITLNSHQETLTVRSKPKHRTFFKYDLISEEKSSQKIEESRNGQRRRTKKKTVNFIIDEKENQEEQLITPSSRKVAKFQKTATQKSSKFAGNSKSPTPNHLSHCDFSEDSLSEWSAKTVVSIKFSNTNHRIPSKRTLRSQQSIFDNPSSRYMIKHTDAAAKPRTRTYIKFPERGISLKNYKSLTSLSEVSIDLKSDWSIAKSRRAKKPTTTNKSLTSSKKLQEKKGRMQNKVSILLKSNDPYLPNDTLRANMEPLKSSTFQELIFKKNTLFKPARTATDPDIFAELNNFHKFLNDNSIEDSEPDLQRALTKPIIIDSSINHRAAQTSRAFQEENLMLDMGLTLLKKISILKQKRL